MKLRVLLVEDEPTLRETLAELIDSDRDMTVVGTAKDAEDGINLARFERPDVVLIDVKMPKGGGPRAAREIRRACPDTQIVVLSAYRDRETVIEMLRAGAGAYIVKGTSNDQILEAIRRAAQGHGSLSTEITGDVINELASLLDRYEALNRELQRGNAQLQDINRSKGELIQILAHELLTPITVIQGFALTIASDTAEVSRDELAGLTQSVVRASDRIRRLVSNLEIAARLDQEGVNLSTYPVPVGDVLARLAIEFAQSRDRLKLPADVDPATRFWADPDLAFLALQVVIENGLALSPEKDPVEVEVWTRDGDLVFAVSDRGPGVPSELRDRIFQAFTQADATTTRTHGGLGIGLYLARQVMRAHQGGIDVASRMGGGSTFLVRFEGFDGTARAGADGLAELTRQGDPLFDRPSK